jgi:hypothetical protein
MFFKKIYNKIDFFLKKKKKVLSGFILRTLYTLSLTLNVSELVKTVKKIVKIVKKKIG